LAGRGSDVLAGAFKAGDRFDEAGAGAHLAETTREAQRESYARFLGFLSQARADLLDLTPEARIDRTIVADYVAWRRSFRKNLRITVDLRQLRGALRLICPSVDWSWLLTIIKRIAAAERRTRPKYHLVTMSSFMPWVLTLWSEPLPTPVPSVGYAKITRFNIGMA
jgi:hypothetical protein